MTFNLQKAQSCLEIPACRGPEVLGLLIEVNPIQEPELQRYPARVEKFCSNFVIRKIMGDITVLFVRLVFQLHSFLPNVMARLLGIESSFARQLRVSCQPWVGPTIKNDILARQVACLSTAKERSESTKLLRRAKTARRNQAAHAKRLILDYMTCGSCRELELLAWPIRFEASR
jgi:hypothetical protein